MESRPDSSCGWRNGTGQNRPRTTMHLPTFVSPQYIGLLSSPRRGHRKREPFNPYGKLQSRSKSGHRFKLGWGAPLRGGHGPSGRTARLLRHNAGRTECHLWFTTVSRHAHNFMFREGLIGVATVYSKGASRVLRALCRRHTC